MNATQLFSCDGSGAKQSSPPSPHGGIGSSSAMQQQQQQQQAVVVAVGGCAADSKANPSNCVFIQGWMLMAMAISIFVPKDSKLLWFMRAHFNRNKDTKYGRGGDPKLKI